MQRINTQQKQSQKLNNKFVTIGSSLFQSLLKSKISINKKNAFDSMKNYLQFNSKRTGLLAKSITKIISKNELKNKKQVINSLLQNRISDILAKREKLRQLKQDGINKSLALISALVKSNINKKMNDAFVNIKTKSLLSFQKKSYKTVHLMNNIKKIERNFLSDALKRINFESFRRLAGYKRCFILERLYLKKRREHLIDGFNNVFEYCSAKLQDERLESKNQLQKKQELSSMMMEQLESQRTSLQSKLTSVKSQSTNLLQSLSTQLSTLEQQLQSIRFEYDLNAQDNNELKQTLKERQNQKELREEGKVKQKEQNVQSGKNKYLMSEYKLWESVLNNLFMYLIKCKDSKQTNQWSFQKLAQTLTQPLPDIYLYPSIQQLIEENAVLKELLETYKQSFTDIDIKPQQKLRFSGEIQTKQKHFFIRSLECLSRWGTEAGDGLQGVRNVLSKLKKK